LRDAGPSRAVTRGRFGSSRTSADCGGEPSDSADGSLATRPDDHARVHTAAAPARRLDMSSNIAYSIPTGERIVGRERGATDAGRVELLREPPTPPHKDGGRGDLMCRRAAESLGTVQN